MCRIVINQFCVTMSSLAISLTIEHNFQLINISRTQIDWIPGNYNEAQSRSNSVSLHLNGSCEKFLNHHETKLIEHSDGLVATERILELTRTSASGIFTESTFTWMAKRFEKMDVSIHTLMRLIYHMQEEKVICKTMDNVSERNDDIQERAMNELQAFSRLLRLMTTLGLFSVNLMRVHISTLLKSTPKLDAILNQFVVGLKYV